MRERVHFRPLRERQAPTNMQNQMACRTTRRGGSLDEQATWLGETQMLDLVRRIADRKASAMQLEQSEQEREASAQMHRR